MSRLPLQFRLMKLDLECELEALLERQGEIELSLFMLDRMSKATHPQDAFEAGYRAAHADLAGDVRKLVGYDVMDTEDGRTVAEHVSRSDADRIISERWQDRLVALPLYRAKFTHREKP